MSSPPTAVTSAYYVCRRKRILSVFDRLGRRIHARLASGYGDAEADAILDDARAERERVIPELPYIGGNRNVFTWVIVVNGSLIALHRAMRRRGREAREAVAVCVEVSDELLRKVPPALLRLVGRLAFTSPARRFCRGQAGELAPYCSFFDVTYSRLMGMGVDASRTIGLGCETCELRYEHGRATRTPPALAPVFDPIDARATK